MSLGSFAKSKMGHKFGGFGSKRIKILNTCFATLKRYILEWNHISCVKMSACILAVGDWKNQKRKQ